MGPNDVGTVWSKRHTANDNAEVWVSRRVGGWLGEWVPLCYTPAQVNATLIQNAMRSHLSTEPCRQTRITPFARCGTKSHREK